MSNPTLFPDFCRYYGKKQSCKYLSLSMILSLYSFMAQKAILLSFVLKWLSNAKKTGLHSKAGLCCSCHICLQKQGLFIFSTAFLIFFPAAARTGIVSSYCFLAYGLFGSAPFACDFIALVLRQNLIPFAYTHLDVYKRQP